MLCSQWSVALPQPAKISHVHQHSPAGMVASCWQGVQAGGGGLSMSSLERIKVRAGRQELFWQTGSKPGHPSSHCHIIFTFCGASRDALCWRLWWQAGATCSCLLLGHVPAQGSLSILTSCSPCCSRQGSHSPSRAILSPAFHG